VQAFVADVVPLELRLRAYAAFRVGLNAGFACGTALGGILVTLAPQWIFWGDALTTLAYGMVAAVFLPVSQRLDSLQASWAAAWQVLRTDRIFWMLAGMEICVSLIWAQFSTTYGRHIMERQLELDFLGWHFTPERVFGLLIGWNGTLVMLLELGASRFTQRFPLRSSMVIGLLLQGLGFSLNAVPGDVTWMLFAMTIFTLGEIWYSPVHSTYIMQISPEQMRGRYQGALGLGSCLARSVGPWMGFLMLAHSPTLLWLSCGALSVVGVLCLLLARAKTILGARNS
jgi:predicted MFS family arabinose efflux permease